MVINVLLRKVKILQLRCLTSINILVTAVGLDVVFCFIDKLTIPKTWVVPLSLRQPWKLLQCCKMSISIQRVRRLSTPARRCTRQGAVAGVLC